MAVAVPARTRVFLRSIPPSLPGLNDSSLLPHSRDRRSEIRFSKSSGDRVVKSYVIYTGILRPYEDQCSLNETLQFPVIYRRCFPGCVCVVMKSICEFHQVTDRKSAV